MINYDIIVLGSGPGGYVAAIRAAQLGMKVGVVEKAELGGICLNWGCIPTKALLKSAQVFEYAKHAADYGVLINGDVEPDFEAIVKRSRTVAENMSKGVAYLFKKNKIDLINGLGKLKPGKIVSVLTAENQEVEYYASHIILATGARSRELPNLPQDGKKIIGYRKAMTLEKLPKSMVVVGSGAIGSEFAYLYNSLGVQVTLVEYMPNILPIEDEEVSKQMERCFKKQGMKIMTASSVKSVVVEGDMCKVLVEGKKGEIEIEAEVVMSAVGITTNIEGIGLEETGVVVKNGKVEVDEYYNTNIEGVHAIGDIVHGPALAHVASAEGIICVEKIAGLNPKSLDYQNIPGCTYTNPEVASVGMTEKAAIDAGFEIKIGKFPFTASGKASASGAKDGFIKVIFDNNTGKCIGAHMIGVNVTEMISEMVLARKMGVTAHEIINTVHPHPTMSEAIMEAVAAAYGEVIHL